MFDKKTYTFASLSKLNAECRTLTANSKYFSSTTTDILISDVAIILMLILSGLVKTYKNIYAPDMSHTVLLWATWIHNIFFVLFFLAFLAHMAAIALRPNWPMVRGIFTGKVRMDYARHRHALWFADIQPVQEPPAVVVAEEQVPQGMDPDPVIEDSTKG